MSDTGGPDSRPNDEAAWLGWLRPRLGFTAKAASGYKPAAADYSRGTCIEVVLRRSALTCPDYFRKVVHITTLAPVECASEVFHNCNSVLRSGCVEDREDRQNLGEHVEPDLVVYP
jgi:hypothetical protein